MNPEQLAAWLERRRYVITSQSLYCMQSHLLNYVRRERRELTVTRHGHPIARLVPLDSNDQPGL